MKHQPWTNAERLDALRLAHRELMACLDNWRFAKRQRNNPNAEVSLGKTLNECKYTKQEALKACKRVEEISYTMQGMRPGEAG